MICLGQNKELERKLIEMNISLHKANDTIKKLGKKLAVESKKNKQLYRMSNYYKEKKEKLKFEYDRTELNVVHLIFYNFSSKGLHANYVCLFPE